MTPAFRMLVAAVVGLATLTTVAVRVGSSQARPERYYVGEQTCMSSGCHAGAYSDTSDYQGAAEFSRTLHQLIHKRPSPSTVLIEKYFAGDSTLIVPVRSIPVVGKDTLLIHLSKTGADYFVQLRFSGGGDSTPRMKVAYTYGGHGWIERFLIEINGSYYMAPFQYVLPGYKERSDTSRAFYFIDLTRWFSVDEATGTGRFFSFTSNLFRTMAWDKECSFCHVNGFSMDRRTNNGDTAYMAGWVGKGEDSATQDINISIGCESCHGPGSEHVAAPTKENIFSPGRLPGTREATDIKIDLCNACHTRIRSTDSTYNFAYDERNNRPWTPGEPLLPYIRGQFVDGQFWPDRVTSYAHHQSGQDFWRGAPYAKHVFTNGCWDCHTVHTAGRNGMPYQLKENYYSTTDGVGCLRCHGSAAPSVSPALSDFSRTTVRNGRVVNAHTQHELRSSACINCHFTKAATISFTALAHKSAYEFSQHDFRVIRPIATREYRNAFPFGLLNSCSSTCHRNGRGSRNLADSMPVAPSYGIDDAIVTVWNESTDIALADSLWYHYQEMFPLSGVRVADAIGSRLAIVSIAPNPLREESTIRFSVPRREDVHVAVYDERGRLVRTLVSGVHDAGSYSERWRGDDDRGAVVPSGEYFVRLVAGGETVAASCRIVR
jgi:hypothetical protein